MDISVVNLVRESKFPNKICLIIPPSEFLMDERVFMSLGVLKVAAVLEQAGLNVSVLDPSGIKNYLDVIHDFARIRTDVVHFGITATTPQLPRAAEIARAIRSVRKDAITILGGPHITLVNAALKKERKLGHSLRAAPAMTQLENTFDILVAGDGEEAVFRALLPDAPKLIDADDVASPLFLTNERLTELPRPARHLVDVPSYRYTIDGIRAISLIAQLGCPFECGFCGGRASPMLRRVRTRTSQSIVDEMVHIYEKYGLCGFMFYDDELNVNPNIVELMDLIASTQKRLGAEWRLRGFIKSQLFKPEQARAMYAAGFREILVGFESGSPEILIAINKKATREQNTTCLRIAHDHKLKVKALMSIGHPGESRATIAQTREWLLAEKPDNFDISLITTFPGTPYYDQAIPLEGKTGQWVYTHKQTGTKLFQKPVDFMATASYYKGDPKGGYRSDVYTLTLTPEELVHARNELEADVRELLGIPYDKSAPAMLYDHSMGQRGEFPSSILRTSP